jgi:hypothetical protein
LKLWAQSYTSRHSSLELAAPDHTVPYGTVLWRDAYPGTSCLATIALSLRNKNHSPIEAPNTPARCDRITSEWNGAVHAEAAWKSYFGRTISKRSRVRQYQCGLAMRPMTWKRSPRMRSVSRSINSSRTCTRFTSPMMSRFSPICRVPHSVHSRLAGTSAIRGGLTTEEGAVVKPTASNSLCP